MGNSPGCTIGEVYQETGTSYNSEIQARSLLQQIRAIKAEEGSLTFSLLSQVIDDFEKVSIRWHDSRQIFLTIV